MRIYHLAAAAILLSGCAADPRTLEKYGDVRVDGSTLMSLTVQAQGAGTQSLPACIASTVRNDAVSLKDSAGSFVGAYTGTYYSATKSREAGGGSVLQYVSPDESKVVAQGTSSYAIPMSSRVVRFTLNATQTATARTYQFSSIDQAQRNTGSSANDGFNPVHIMTGGGSEDVLSSLKDVADQIESCLR